MSTPPLSPQYISTAPKRTPPGNQVFLILSLPQVASFPQIHCKLRRRLQCRKKYRPLHLEYEPASVSVFCILYYCALIESSSNLKIFAKIVFSMKATFRQFETTLLQLPPTLSQLPPTVLQLEPAVLQLEAALLQLQPNLHKANQP